MRRRTSVDLILLVLLLAVAARVWQGAARRRERPAPETREASLSENTPRMQELMLRTPAPAPAGQQEAASAPAEAPASGWVTVQVIESDGLPPSVPVTVFTPEGQLRENAALGLLVLTAEPGELILMASAEDEGLGARVSEPVRVRVQGGGRHTVQLRLPAPEPASPVLAFPGLTLLPGDGYAVVDRVFPDSPAHLAGIHPGDAVLWIDSAPIGDLGGEALNELLYGAPGQPVRLRMVIALESGELQEVETLLDRIPVE